MHIAKMDLNLLSVAEALFRHKNVSKAGQELGLSQSAVSHALSRLRDHFKDPLFVRTSKGVAPTEFARQIETEIYDLVQRAQLLAARKRRFEPLTAEGRIVLATNDYFESIVVPKLQLIIEREAPNVQLSIRPTQGELPKRELEEGKIDFAIAGFYRDLPEGFYQTKLFTDTFSAATRKDHPVIRTVLDEERYFNAKHALITLQGDLSDNVSMGVGKHKRFRKITYGSYSFTAPAWVLQRSDLVLTAPTLLLKQYEEHFPIKIWPCPVDLGSIDVRMVWHEQTNRNALRSWFREKLREQCRHLS